MCCKARAAKGKWSTPKTTKNRRVLFLYDEKTASPFFFWSAIEELKKPSFFVRHVLLCPCWNDDGNDDHNGNVWLSLLLCAVPALYILWQREAVGATDFTNKFATKSARKKVL